MAKSFIKPLAIALCVLGCISLPAYAAQAKKNKNVGFRKKHSTQPTKATPQDSYLSSVYQQDARGLLRLGVLPFDFDVPGQAFVTTGPYVGVPVQYSGNDLIINTPSVNTDVQLLRIRKGIREELIAKHRINPSHMADHPHLILSGALAGQANYMKKGQGGSSSDIDVASSSLDAFFIGPSDWLLGFMELSFDNSRLSTNGVRVSNSRVYVNKAFITLGNFAESPFYGSIGQMYVPFGAYSSVMISDTLPKSLGRTKERALLAGFQQQSPNAFYGAVYGFKGDSHLGAANRVNNGGLNVGYRFEHGSVRGGIGAGMIANLADSLGMQNSAGFSTSATTEMIVHRVPAYDLRGTLSVGSAWDFVGEYVGASTRFNPNNLMFNGQGAKPWALDLEAVYSFYICDNKPSSFAVGYGRSKEALALGLPAQRYSLLWKASLLRNTLQSIEFRHDMNYSAGTTASGPGGNGTTSASGKADNAITAEFNYYF